MTANANGISKTRVILVGLVGNIMEWYDFAVYGYFAVVIGHKFFPSEDPAVSVIAAFGAFAAGFLVRPLGGLLFGRIGDLVGRKRALTLSVLTMAVPTVLLGCLPTYDAMGIAAPILLVLMRIVQGLSVGGEYTSSLIFMAEHAQPNRRAITSIWGMWGATAGILLGSGVGSIFTGLLTEMQISSWGWRLPFLMGALVALTGYLIRRSIHAEVPVGESKSPVVDTFSKYRMSVVRVALLNVGFGAGFYVAFIYAVTYVKSIDKLSAEIAFNLNTASMALLLLILPGAAWLSDRCGRKPLLIAGSAILTFGAIPLFHLIHSTDPATIFLGETGFVLALGLIGGGIVAANVELMPAPVRCTGLAFAYNASIGWFGGTTPMISAWLIASTGNPIMPAYWIAVTGAVSLLTALFLIQETRDQNELSPKTTTHESLIVSAVGLFSLVTPSDLYKSYRAL
jgi:MHS family proline/betaine transporter-like MFS transporter